VFNFRAATRVVWAGAFVCLLALPAAFLVTVLIFPFWRWFETATGIESFGHSGPAEWCFWFMYILLLSCATIVCWRLRRGAQNRQPADDLNQQCGSPTAEALD